MLSHLFLLFHLKGLKENLSLKFYSHLQPGSSDKKVTFVDGSKPYGNGGKL